MMCDGCGINARMQMQLLLYNISISKGLTRSLRWENTSLLRCALQPLGRMKRGIHWWTKSRNFGKKGSLSVLPALDLVRLWLLFLLGSYQFFCFFFLHAIHQITFHNCGTFSYGLSPLSELNINFVYYFKLWSAIGLLVGWCLHITS